MIRRLSIQNFKSIADLQLSLGRINVFIGENGAGKSNILEALAFGAAAAKNQLRHEFLATRGVRSVDPALMRSAFDGSGEEIRIGVSGEEEGEVQPLRLRWEEERWLGQIMEPPLQGHVFDNDDVGLLISEFRKIQNDILSENTKKEMSDGMILNIFKSVLDLIHDEGIDSGSINRTGLPSFLAFAPEYSALRIFQDESQILPLGIRGEGLFSHLQALSRAADPIVFQKIADELDILDWFEGFTLPSDLAPGERRLRLRDRYLTEQTVFDQRSANEGFLFLLFYFTLVISPQTPPVFAVDNVDASLNPKLCTALIRRLAQLSATHNKQLFLTTHNPAVLDGLNLEDDEQRLFVVSRNRDGHTQVRRVEAPRPLPGDSPVPLSEAFLKGYLGGLPRNF